MKFRNRPFDRTAPTGAFLTRFHAVSAGRKQACGKKAVLYPGLYGAAGAAFLNGAESPDYARRVLIFGCVLLAAATAALALTFFRAAKLRKESRELRVLREKQRSYFSDVDALTGLPNRKGVRKVMTEWLELCRGSGTDGGVFFLDVDNFRSVNNTFGHDAGDKFLCEMSVRLQNAAGKQNIVGRIGGDEFALFISGVNRAEELEDFAKKLMHSFRQPYLINGIVIQLTCSVGAILFHCREAKKLNEFDEIINRGEFVLQEVKTNHKGGYALFSSAFGNLIDRRLQLENALKYSIERDELLCYMQPQYDCRRKEVIGFESLARWKSRRFGIISPAQFIPMAEKSGFIKELGRFVVEQTFRFAQSVRGKGVCVSFNASPVELLQANFADYIIGRFECYGLSPGSVAVEVTESCLIESFDEVIQKLSVLSEHGIQVYLDDFGTGFSSLTYLKKLPIHSVKIDKSFIDEIVTDRVEKDIVEMIIRLARRLSLDVIAEGVETKEQLTCVVNAGCDIVQGYYISRPVPLEESMPLLEGRRKKIAVE